MSVDSVEYIISFIFTLALIVCLICIASRLTSILYELRNLNGFSIIPRSINLFIERKDAGSNES